MHCLSNGTRLSQLLGGRGGGLAFSLVRVNITVTVKDSVFLYNNATLFGGAVVVVTNAPIPDYQFVFQQLEMKGNLAGLAGGAVALAPFSEKDDLIDVHMRVLFEDCQFDDNGGLFGSQRIKDRGSSLHRVT